MSKRVCHHVDFVWAALVALSLLGLAACTSLEVLPQASGGDSSGDVESNGLPLTADGRPVGWEEFSHSKDADPGYAQVFPQGAVRRIDITITPSDWQTMLDDMTSNHGGFGEGGQGFGGMPGGGGAAGVNSSGLSPPAEMLAACADLAVGDACTALFNGASMAGTCADVGAGDLVCRPPLDSGEFPAGPAGANANGPSGSDALEACATLLEGDACTISFNNAPVAGTCTATGDGGLACATSAGPGQPGGLPGGGLLDNDEDNPVMVPCTVAFDDLTWWYVGIRFKGLSSLTSTWSSGCYKLPFRLDFDALEDDHPEIDNQRFFGFQKLSFASNWSDPSYLREKVTHDIFREAGVPAPRTAFYRVYVDVGQGPTYFGLYALTEIPDDPMLASQFGDDGGNLYKPVSRWTSFVEDEFEKQSNKNAADWSDVEAAVTALNADRSDAEAWRAGLEAVFNVDGFLRWLAVNTVIQNWDTYGRMAHNYYLYGNPLDEGRLNWIPWDNNMAFMTGMDRAPDAAGAGRGSADEGLSLGLTEVGEEWPLIRFLLDDPVYQAAYVAQVEEFVAGVFDVNAVQARFQAEHDLIAPYVTGAEGEQAGYTLLSAPEEFDTGLDSLLDFIAARAAAASEFLEAAP